MGKDDYVAAHLLGNEGPVGIPELSVEVTLNSGDSVIVPVLFSDRAQDMDDGTSMVGVILTHGAGGDMESPHMRMYVSEITKNGLPVVHFSCKSPSLEYRSRVYEKVLKALTSWPATKHIQSWVLAGHSMGSRVAIEVAHKFETSQDSSFPRVLGCVLFSWPVHAQNNPSELRDQGNLCKVNLPILMVQGTRDEWSQEDHFQDLVSRISTPKLKVYRVEGAEHHMCPHKRISNKEERERTEANILAALREAGLFIKDLSIM
ncbi:hypothetical protein CEUSTIGMA_g8623.t1 [Chlamydomonas eustigma]|uniref:KANL3/Tex30 alpha/beta hydrolase-like domain-containing protein n=1 Tax=Chlamydomonas eustigma TaxID=1157962 RepID=A0A250XEJ1_9CHLO|nr:hypothetical protein CEUSTIGMA_g8623.t1 [Chlamydomonas eustigma]|eukprot:GAX81190.1 hypothetical protein CEUSTIGMA_g8623.t1 [Chlamydomonas eustigma]